MEAAGWELLGVDKDRQPLAGTQEQELTLSLYTDS